MMPTALARRQIGPLGMVTLALWAVGIVLLVLYLVRVWDPQLVETYGPVYLRGLGTTLSLVAWSYGIGALLSVPLVMGRMSSNRWARGASFGYVSFFRGTPAIAQIFLVYYGFGSFRGAFESVGLWWFFREAWYCAIFALALNTAAYQTEILRGAVESVGRGQWEGARSLALPRFVTLWRIITPQALMVALRPYANEFILMVKASAIVAIITVFDLFGETRRAFSKTFDFQTYVWAAIFYLVIVEVVRNLTALAEKRLARHLIR
ncbi:ABC transporter permease [Aureimonas pseudogalii]|uniref:Polar amino acid transport system permease protein n=1 Tax=Aureimonas pseudogalii TaxID=1744844 RepID=A0A7W6H3L7_9HYPH|nr:ABC transporter permease [Aureimonas pseudogalii]MBB3998206.1 polar amino acid transport system permease protein [Aureimonas pseudogalii]